MQNLRAGVLFDVDGTLVDTNYLHTLAWSRALRDAGEWAPMHAIHRLVGMGSDQLVIELLGHGSDVAVERREVHYRGGLIDESRAFPGAADLLRRIHRAGLAVVLASSSPKDELQVSCERIDAEDAIDATTSADDVSEAKPAPDVFLAALEAGSIDPARAIVVGDSVWDVDAADAAGLPTIAVESGGFSRHELSERGALSVYRNVKDLGDQLLTSPIAHLMSMAMSRAR